MIRMKKLTDYGIVLLTHLAREEGALVHSARDLSVASHLPGPTVNKLLKKLSQAGLLVSHRGANGGYMLARDPAEISVAQAITALEGPIAVTECSSDVVGLCGLEQFCPNRGGWRNISNAIRSTLESLTLRDIAHPNPAVSPSTVAGAASKHAFDLGMSPQKIWGAS
jgi:FeS assembly SUF system regulator